MGPGNTINVEDTLPHSLIYMFATGVWQLKLEANGLEARRGKEAPTV